jgi:hypothetical protein
LHGISFRSTCFGARPRTPGRVPVQQVELKTERVAMAYRLSLAYTLAVRRLSKIAHTYRLIVTGVVGNFIHVFDSQTEMQKLIVLTKAVLTHTNRHSDTGSVRPLRVLPLQLT